ncbi:Major facilitator superfamily associated domain [Trinorchestia longiramus]|nr:Major facilitator superfamily associated domain [Trinorchestia longiramus]
MKAVKRTLPIKVHYFLFFASLAPVLPFLMVVGLQLGVPVSVQGAVTALTLLTVVVFKPLIAAAADSFPALRKPIFITLLVLMTVFYSAIYFIKPFRAPEETSLSATFVFETELPLEFPSVENRSLHSCAGTTQTNSRKTEPPSAAFYLNIDKSEQTGDWPSENVVMSCCADVCTLTPASSSSSCYRLLLDLRSPSTTNSSYLSSYSRGPGKAAISATDNDCIYCTAFLDTIVSCTPEFPCVGQLESAIEHAEKCNAAAKEYSIWREPNFYAFILLMMGSMLMFSTANSISDAICLDCVGSDGDYGSQRAWGSAGWAALGLASGATVDWWSTDDVTKDYAPAFLFTLVLGLADVMVSSCTLKVPKLEQDTSVWHDLKPLLRRPVFLVFLFFVIMNGCFDGIVATYVFVLQEEIAAGTSAMQHMKLLQGLTIVAQSGSEIPFMYICDRLTKKFNPENLTTVVYGLYGVRFFLLGIIGLTGKVWLTLLVELLNGPCYGLGYTAIVVYAGRISPPGTSATVQSVTNICYEAIGYSIACLLGGVFIQLLGGAINYLMFCGVACLICVMHWITFSKFIVHSDTDQTSATQRGEKETIKVDIGGDETLLEPLTRTAHEGTSDSRSGRHTGDDASVKNYNN